MRIHCTLCNGDDMTLQLASPRVTIDKTNKMKGFLKSHKFLVNLTSIQFYIIANMTQCVLDLNMNMR